MFFEQALIIYREIGYHQMEAITLARLGGSYWIISLAYDELDRQRAISYTEQAIRVFEEIEDPAAGMVREQLAEWGGQSGTFLARFWRKLRAWARREVESPPMR